MKESETPYYFPPYQYGSVGDGHLIPPNGGVNPHTDNAVKMTAVHSLPNAMLNARTQLIRGKLRDRLTSGQTQPKDNEYNYALNSSTYSRPSYESMSRAFGNCGSYGGHFTNAAANSLAMPFEYNQPPNYGFPSDAPAYSGHPNDMTRHVNSAQTIKYPVMSAYNFPRPELVTQLNKQKENPLLNAAPDNIMEVKQMTNTLIDMFKTQNNDGFQINAMKMLNSINNSINELKKSIDEIPIKIAKEFEKVIAETGVPSRSMSIVSEREIEECFDDMRLDDDGDGDDDEEEHENVEKHNEESGSLESNDGINKENNSTIDKFIFEYDPTIDMEKWIKKD